MDTAPNGAGESQAGSGASDPLSSGCPKFVPRSAEKRRAFCRSIREIPYRPPAILCYDYVDAFCRNAADTGAHPE